MTTLICTLCEAQLRKDKALDAKWEEYRIKKKFKYLCRACAKMVAQDVIDEY